MPPIKSKKSKQAEDRPVKHPELATRECWGDQAISVEKMKELLGWTPETDDVKHGDFYNLTDKEGVKVVLANSTRNRPLSMSLVDNYLQEILNKRWRVNGETMIFGKYGEAISGQHRGVAHILAEQVRLKSPHWQDLWPEPITFSTVVVVGVEETDDVVNTVDTGKPRSVADTIYRSDHFADLPPKPRKTASTMANWAVKMLWLRSGAMEDPFETRDLKLTHGAALEFLDNHLTVRKAVRHVMEEDAAGGISKFLSPGYSAALLYLMAQSAADPAKYREKAKEGTRAERYLIFDLLDKAMEFFVELGQLDDAGRHVSEVGKAVAAKVRSLSTRKDGDGEPILATWGEKLVLLVYAWKAFAEGKPVTFPGDDELMHDCPTLGGIDLGEDGCGDDDPADKEEDEDPVEAKRRELEATRPAREEARKKEIIAEREQAKELKSRNGQFEEFGAQYPGRTLLFRSRSGGYAVWGPQAEGLVRILRLPTVTKTDGLTRAMIPDAKLEQALKELHAAGHHVTVLEEKIVGQAKVKTIVPTHHDAPAKAAEPKPKAKALAKAGKK